MAIARKLDELNLLEKELNHETQAISKQIGELKNKQKLIADKISKLAKQKINALIMDDCLSEHAMIRYMERVEGKDLSYLKSTIVTDKVKEKIKEIKGFGVIDVGEYRMVVKGGIICSILLPPYSDDQLKDRLQLFFLTD